MLFKVDDMHNQTSIRTDNSDDSQKTWLTCIAANKKIIIPAGIAAVVVIAAAVFMFAHGDNPATPPAERGNNKTSLEATGYTGVTQDVLTNQTFDCAPRNENEWYRSDHTFTIDPSNPNTMYVNVEYKGFYKTTDGGKTWTQKTKGIKVYARSDDKTKGCYSEYPVVRIDPGNSKHLILGISGGGGGFLDATTPNSQTGGAYQSYDGGNTWQLMINNHMDIYVTDLAFDPSSPKTIYYGTASNPASWQGADQNKLYVTKGLVYKTSSSAQNRDWMELPTGLGNRTGAEAILVNDKDGKQINIPTFSAVRQSADGSGTGISTGKNTSVPQLGILKTIDGGNTWTTTQLPGSPAIREGYACAADFSHQFYMPTGTDRPLSYASLDGGTTFIRTSMSMDVVAYDPFDASCNHLLGYSNSAGTPTIPNLNLFESNDGGLTWKPHGSLPVEITDLNNPKVRPSVIAWHPTDKNTIFMAGAGGHIWKSTDFGSSWSTLLDYTKL